MATPTYYSACVRIQVLNFSQDKIFVVNAQSAKTAKFFNLENFRLYGITENHPIRPRARARAQPEGDVWFSVINPWLPWYNYSLARHTPQSKGKEESGDNAYCELFCWNAIIELRSARRIIFLANCQSY